MNGCIILAGGSGNRYESQVPKQFTFVNDKPILLYSLEAFDKMDAIDLIIIVSLEEWKESIEQWISDYQIQKVKSIVNPGEYRQLSIKNGLGEMAKYLSGQDRVLIHDSARPLVNPEVVTKVIEASYSTGISLPVLPIHDAIYKGNGKGQIEGVIPRDFFFHGQTPVCASFGVYSSLYKEITEEQLKLTYGLCQLMLDKGFKVTNVLGDEKTFKITKKEDLIRFKDELSIRNQKCVES